VIPEGATRSGIFKRKAASNTSGVDSSANFAASSSFFTNITLRESSQRSQRERS
jgi:hypothetical protein